MSPRSSSLTKRGLWWIKGADQNLSSRRGAGRFIWRSQNWQSSRHVFLCILVSERELLTWKLDWAWVAMGDRHQWFQISSAGGQSKQHCMLESYTGPGQVPSGFQTAMLMEGRALHCWPSLGRQGRQVPDGCIWGSGVCATLSRCVSRDLPASQLTLGVSNQRLAGARLCYRRHIW